jgi:transcription elongation factor Elf1
MRNFLSDLSAGNFDCDSPLTSWVVFLSMRIKEIKSRNRRDFHATFVCEHCGAEKDLAGYDDERFHQNVIPKMECESCGKSARDLHSRYAEVFSNPSSLMLDKVLRAYRHADNRDAEGDTILSFIEVAISLGCTRAEANRLYEQWMNYENSN